MQPKPTPDREPDGTVRDDVPTEAPAMPIEHDAADDREAAEARERERAVQTRDAYGHDPYGNETFGPDGRKVEAPIAPE